MEGRGRGRRWGEGEGEGEGAGRGCRGRKQSLGEAGDVAITEAYAWGGGKYPGFSLFPALQSAANADRWLPGDAGK